MVKSKTSPRRTGKTRDARGREVKLLDPYPLYMLGREDVIHRDSLESVMVDLDPKIAAAGSLRSRRRLAIIVTSVIVLLTVIAMATIIVSGDKNALRTLFSPSFLLMWIGCAAFPIIIARSGRMKKVKRVMLAHHLCPHCGYDLHGKPSDDGCITACSECGCGWILPVQRTKRATPLGPEQRASNRRFKIFLLIGLGLFAFFVISMLIFEFNN